MARRISARNAERIREGILRARLFVGSREGIMYELTERDELSWRAYQHERKAIFRRQFDAIEKGARG